MTFAPSKKGATLQLAEHSLLPNGPDLLWLGAFWGLLALMACLEIFAPASDNPVQRETRWFTNFGMGLVNMAVVPLAPVSAVLAADWAQRTEVGLLNLIEQSWWASVLATLILRSLSGYALHVVFHKVPLLWRIHRVHHADTHLDVSTAVRAHPAEIGVSWITMVTLSVLLGLNPIGLAAYEIAESLLSLITHANLRLPQGVDRPIRWMFVTPNMHCVHHSADQPETDSNYGTVLSIWDRLFGTYCASPTGGYGSLRVGLSDQRERASDFWWQIKSPVLSDAAQQDEALLGQPPAKHP
jgi:sterol desaturase/sphingolipid hydroxylase (fatty acid hydroxylase superfamily)